MAYRSATLTKQTNFNKKDLNQKVRKARKEKKIFLVLGGYERLRQSLIARGWIERIPEDRMLFVPPNSERYALALLLKNFPCFFFWQPRFRPVDNLRSGKPLVGTILRESNLNFTSKEGLNNCALNHHWYHIPRLTDLNYQRSHVLSDNASKEEFSRDFKRTAFTNFIMFLKDNSEDFQSLFTPADSGIPIVCVELAIKQIELFIAVDNSDDLDTSRPIDLYVKRPKDQAEMLTSIRQIINGSRRFKLESDSLINSCLSQVLECAEKITDQWPHVKYDGYHNIWIMKPIGQSSGYGVTVMKSEEKVLSEVREYSSKPFIVQKYIEKPLIVHNRKFDMRIYFITFIRDGFVDVWLYKDCYVKFSTPEFRLDNLDRSIHVTNYAVQKHFMNPLETVANAKENMWSLSQLIEYFESIDKANVWSSQIYPGIKKNLLAVILASLEDTELTVNNFELNGADFMIGFDYEPVLIEINSKPALYFSRTVIEMITDRLLGDVVKVTVDYQRDSSASTGDFELIHSFEIPFVERAYIEGTIVGTRMPIRKPGRTSMKRIKSADADTSTSISLALKSCQSC